ncbi:ATPase, F1 complex, gamma subunit domain-containing protein [Chiua virens]|nr:ATPase, F1 complex, gamma subunit domain-containing protein [Chiua virens]
MFARQSVARLAAQQAHRHGAAPKNARNMATLREIELRLKSVRNIEKITKSMKMIASTKLAKAQRAMVTGKEYGIANSGASRSPTRVRVRPLTPTVVPQKSLTIPPQRHPPSVNSSLSFRPTRVSAVVSTPRSRKPPAVCSQTTENPVDADSPVMVIGDKSKGQLARAVGKNLALTFNQIGRDIPTFADAAGVADLIVKSGVEYDSITIVHNKFVSAISYEAGTVEVANENIFKESPGFRAYEMEDDVTKDLAEFSLANAIYAALVEAHACEQSARRNAMDNASKNAKDMINTLTMQYNRGRQAAITNELVDIITGASQASRHLVL